MQQFGTVPAMFLSSYVLSFVPSVQLKLQKLIYYCEGWHLAYFERSLIPENFEAWVHGPVIRTVWDSFKGLGNAYRTQFYVNSEHANRLRAEAAHRLNPQQIEMIGDVLKEYGDKSAYHLEYLSHSEPPWKEARRGYDPSERSATVISKETMKSYYQSLFST